MYVRVNGNGVLIINFFQFLDFSDLLYSWMWCGEEEEYSGGDVFLSEISVVFMELIIMEQLQLCDVMLLEIMCKFSYFFD